MTATTRTQSSLATQTDTSQRGALLRNTLLANAAFSGISGAVLLLASSPVAEFMGIAEWQLVEGLGGATVLSILGIGLFIWMADVLFVATRSPMETRLAWGIVAGDMLWVVGSALILLTNALPLTTGGGWLVLILADAVLVFALVQIVGIRRLARQS